MRNDNGGSQTRPSENVLPRVEDLPSVTTRAQVTRMQEVEIQSLQMDRFSDLLPPDRIIRFASVAAEARSLTQDRVMWNVNATAQGGGVAEMLQTLLAYGRRGRGHPMAGPRRRPGVLRDHQAVHNMLHGEAGDGGALGDAERASRRRSWQPNIEEMMRAGLARATSCCCTTPRRPGWWRGSVRRGALVVWRCHVGRDAPNELTEWLGLPAADVQHADAFVFSRRPMPRPGCRPEAVIIPPSIDPFSAKNSARAMHEVRGDPAPGRAGGGSGRRRAAAVRPA